MAAAMGVQVGLQPQQRAVAGLVTGRNAGETTHSTSFSASSSVFCGRRQAAAVVPVRTCSSRASSVVHVSCGAAATVVDSTAAAAGTNLHSHSLQGSGGFRV